MYKKTLTDRKEVLTEQLELLKVEIKKVNTHKKFEKEILLLLQMILSMSKER